MFDGASVVFDADGKLVARGKQFEEDLLIVDIEIGAPITGRIETALEPMREIYEALVLGTRDYVRKNGFTDVLIGLSGGIDSSLVAAIAVDALGAEHVHRRDHAVALFERGQRQPMQIALAERLGIRTFTVPIEPAHVAFETDACAGVRRHAEPTWPRRTCRRASAATCS